MKKKKRIVAIIQARLSSKRLPGKVLMKLGNKPVLQHVVDRVSAVNLLERGLIDDIVVATSIKQKDHAIMSYCRNHRIHCFRGPEENVLARMYDCAKAFKADYIIRVTADCPFIEPMMIYGLIKSVYGSYHALAFNERRIPPGWDCEIFTMQALRDAYNKDVEREHVSKGMRFKNEDMLDKGTDFRFYDVSLELNTARDYERLCKYAKLLG